MRSFVHSNTDRVTYTIIEGIGSRESIRSDTKAKHIDPKCDQLTEVAKALSSIF